MMTRCSPPMFVQNGWASCSGESRNRPTCLQTASFELLDCTAIKLKRPKVTGGEVGVSSDTIRARPKAKQSRRHIMPQCKQNSINIYKKQQQINSASLNTGEDRVVLAFGKLEPVPALTVTSPVRCSLIPDNERRALFLLSSHQFGNL